MKRLSSERGIALAVAIFALVVIGGLVAGSMFVATNEMRIGRNTLRQQTAFTAAETATQDVVLNFSYKGLPVGGTVVETGKAPDGRGWYKRTVQRLSQMLFVVRTDGFNTDSTSRQRVGALLRLRPLAFNINAALKTQGDVRLGGSTFVDGRDNVPTGWTGCPATLPTLPGIRLPDPTDITTSGCNNLSCVNGDPKVLKDTTIHTEGLMTVGDIPFDSLKAFANKILPGGSMRIDQSLTVSLACNTADPYNWGDGTNQVAPCHDYFPIIWIEGSANINGVQGQGVLIVNGDLNVQGGFQFYGPVLVKGTVNTEGTGGHFNGGVIAANVNLQQDVILGNAVINFSSCALIRVLTQTATATVFRERSWMNLY